MTLYAQWTANATDTYSYIANGGSGTAPVSGSGLDGTAITLAANPFTYPGHTFTGWSDGTLSYPAGSTYLLSSVGAPIVFSAQWSANPTDTVTFNSEGGSVVSSQSGLAGTTITLPSAPTQAGYTFNGWFAAPSGGSALTSPYTLAGSVTLYAQWSANATDTLTFNTQGGSAVSSQSGLDGTTVTLPSAPTRAGYTFNGWFAAPSGGSALTSPYTLAGSVTLYAQWTPVVPVTVQVSGTQTYGGGPSFTYTTTPSGVSVTSLICTTVGSSTPINPSLAAGTYTILGSTCSGSAGASYSLTFTGVSTGFVVSKASVTVQVSGTQTYGGGSSFAYTTTPSGVSVTSLKCTTVGSSTPINSSLPAGTYTILGSTCSGSAGANYTPSFTGMTNGYVVSMATQTLKFTSTAPTKALVGGATYTPTASATSKLTVTITVDSSASAVCSISPAGSRELPGGRDLLPRCQSGWQRRLQRGNPGPSVLRREPGAGVRARCAAHHRHGGQRYSYTFSANGTPVPKYALSTGAPSWLSINLTTGVVTATPPSGTTTFSYSVIASNSAGKATVGPFKVRVSP